jgi:hypothetical protein
MLRAARDTATGSKVRARAAHADGAPTAVPAADRGGSKAVTARAGSKVTARAGSKVAMACAGNEVAMARADPTRSRAIRAVTVATMPTIRATSAPMEGPKGGNRRVGTAIRTGKAKAIGVTIARATIDPTSAADRS